MTRRRPYGRPHIRPKKVDSLDVFKEFSSFILCASCVVMTRQRAGAQACAPYRKRVFFAFLLTFGDWNTLIGKLLIGN